jgi:hypothetical protein
MGFQVLPAGPPDPAAQAAVQARTAAQRVGEPAPTSGRPARVIEGATVDTLPSRPPVEVLAEMEAASRRYEELRAQHRELHFKHDPDANRVVVEVRDLEGTVLRTIPPSKALDVVAGAPLD